MSSRRRCGGREEVDRRDSSHLKVFFSILLKKLPGNVLKPPCKGQLNYFFFPTTDVNSTRHILEIYYFTVCGEFFSPSTPLMNTKCFFTSKLYLPKKNRPLSDTGSPIRESWSPHPGKLVPHFDFRRFEGKNYIFANMASLVCNIP